MFDVDETINAFRRGVLNVDCKRIILTQHNEGGERFEGQGYIRQTDDGTLIFKIYVTRFNATPLRHLSRMFGDGIGNIYRDEAFYDLDATGYDGTRWSASRILPQPNWDMSDMTVLMQGTMQSMTGRLDMPQRYHYLRLHFFEEYEVPCLKMSKAERYEGAHFIADHAQFEACGAKFKVQQREGSGDTIVELTSETSIPEAFDLRIQEAVQFLTAKSAFWRARLQSDDNRGHLVLSSPPRKSVRTQFRPPISRGSSGFFDHGWRLFGAYLAYVSEKTHGTHWNPVAYHLYNACEATANSVDAWAVGVSIAVEAIAGLIPITGDSDKRRELRVYQERANAWLTAQNDLPEDIVKRARGQISAMSNGRPQDTLHWLASRGRVERDYVDAWTYLRNRHVHPKPQDLRKPTSLDMQKLLDQIQKVEVLLRQLTFHLIGYEGPFTDYGAHDSPTKQYPLASKINPA